MSDLKFPQLPEAYRTVQQIYSSATHKVYWGLCRVPDQQGAVEVAIRVINLEMLEDVDAMASLRSEVQAMKSLNHPNILKYHTSFPVEDTLWIIMELAHHGSARALMAATCPGGFHEATCVYMLYHVLRGLAYLHEQDYVHRDIKGAHILVDKKGNVFLSSFSVSTFMLESGERKAATTLVGSLPWMGPEVLVHGKDRKYSTSVDIWSLGMTAIELAMGEAPYEKIAHEAMRMIKTVREDPPCIPPSHEFSRHYHSFVADCLQREPEQRPTAHKLLEHKLFKKIKKTPEDYLMKLLPPLQTESPSPDAAFERPRSDSVLSFKDLLSSSTNLPSVTEQLWAKNLTSKKTTLPKLSDSSVDSDSPAPVRKEQPTRAELAEKESSGAEKSSMHKSTDSQGKSSKDKSKGKSPRSKSSKDSSSSEKSGKEKSSKEKSGKEKSGKEETSEKSGNGSNEEEADPSWELGSPASERKEQSEEASGEVVIRPPTEEERAQKERDRQKREDEERRAKEERAARRVGGDEPSEPLLSAGQQRSMAVPIETYMGEDSQDYVIMIRTITGTTLTFRVKGCDFIIGGELPALPDLPGVELRSTPVRKFEKKIHLPEEINAEGVRREKLSGTIVIRIRKAHTDLGSVTM